jgi:hypothetical protein
MDLWDEAADQMAKDQIKSILDGGDFVLFFKKGKELFAGPENSRVVFATMKNPDDETPESWAKEANFSAIDLNKALEGMMVKRMFGYKDLKDIEVMDSEAIQKLLVKKADKMNAKINLIKVIKDLPDDEDEPGEPPNMDRIGEK